MGGPRRWVLAAGILAVVSVVPVVVTTAAVSDRSSSVEAVLEPVAHPRATDVPPGFLRLPALPPPPDLAAAPAEPLADASVEAAESAAAGSTELAVAVLDRRTGEVGGGARADEPFRTASLSKLVVAVDILDRRRTGGLEVDDGDIDLIERALGPSDDAAMNELWVRFDGAGAPARLSPRLGLTATAAPQRPGQWGEMLVSATDWVRIWEHIVEGMPSTDRDLLVSAMAAAPATARDGFDQAFGLLAPAARQAGAIGGGPAPDGVRGLPDVAGPPAAPDPSDLSGTAAKQGWMCCFSGDYYLHSAGLVGADQRYVVVLLSRIPRSGWEAARAELTAVAEATLRALSPEPRAS